MIMKKKSSMIVHFVIGVSNVYVEKKVFMFEMVLDTILLVPFKNRSDWHSKN